MWKKYGAAREVTDDNIMWHIHFAYWITMARIQTHTHTHTHTLRICNMYCLSTASSNMNVPKYYKYIACLGLLVIDYQDNSRYFKNQIESNCTMSCEDHHLCCDHDRVEKVYNIRLKGQQWKFVHTWHSVGILQACFPYAQYIVELSVWHVHLLNGAWGSTVVKALCY